ncbi:MAG: alpha/beta hydrolase family protein, partial [Rickettsiales bacterium]
APEQNYLLDNLERIPNHIPVNIIHGEDDMLCSISQAETLAKAFEKQGNKPGFYRLPHTGHADSEPKTEQALTLVMDRLAGLKQRAKSAERMLAKESPLKNR